MDKILRIGIISDERKRDNGWEEGCAGGLQWLYALLFTRVSGTRKQSCNLAEAQRTDGGPWWGLRGTECRTWPDLQVPQVPKASLGVGGNLTHCNAPCGASAQKRQGRGQGIEALQGSSPLPVVSSCEGEKVGKAAGNMYISTAKESRMTSGPWHLHINSMGGSLQPKLPWGGAAAAPRSGLLLHLRHKSPSILPDASPNHLPEFLSNTTKTQCSLSK